MRTSQGRSLRRSRPRRRWLPACHSSLPFGMKVAELRHDRKRDRRHSLRRNLRRLHLPHAVRADPRIHGRGSRQIRADARQRLPARRDRDRSQGRFRRARAMRVGALGTDGPAQPRHRFPQRREAASGRRRSARLSLRLRRRARPVCPSGRRLRTSWTERARRGAVAARALRQRPAARAWSRPAAGQSASSAIGSGCSATATTRSKRSTPSASHAARDAAGITLSWRRSAILAMMARDGEEWRHDARSVHHRGFGLRRQSRSSVLFAVVISSLIVLLVSD